MKVSRTTIKIKHSILIFLDIFEEYTKGGEFFDFKLANCIMCVCVSRSLEPSRLNVKVLHRGGLKFQSLAELAENVFINSDFDLLSNVNSLDL